MNQTAKNRRVKLGKVLVDAWGNRDKVKRLIRYPELKSIEVNASGTNVTVKIESVSKNDKTDLSDLAGSEIESNTARIDVSRDDSALEISAEQNGAAWDLSEVDYKIQYDDGSIIKKNLFDAKSGDGSGGVVVASLVEKIPSPVGWPKL